MAYEKAYFIVVSYGKSWKTRENQNIFLRGPS